MTTSLILSLFASAYGSGSYSENNYNGTDAAAAAATTGSLSDTGILIGLIVGISATILLVAMIVRIWKRPSRAQAFIEKSPED
jgi:hypothetical protein